MGFKSYLRRIWEARYFWSHLARAELRIKFRRSSLGILWALLNPLLLTALFSLVIGGMFKQEWREFAPYVFSGIIVWEYLVSSIIAGCNSIINAEAYIKQFNHPMSIYTLKTVLVNIVTFLIAFIGLLIWVGIAHPDHLILSFVTLPLSFALLLVLGWPIAMISAIINTKFRDFQQLMVILLQAVYYVSPIFFDVKMFKAANLSFLLKYNPITYVMNLIRKPLLYGVYPSSLDYIVVVLTIIVLYLIAIIKTSREEKDIIYYI